MLIEDFISTVFGKVIEELHKCLIRSKLHIEVTYFRYSLIKNEPGSIFVYITPYPSRYIVALSLSNIGEKTTTIKQISAIINKELELDCPVFKPIRLEPGDFKKSNLIFPIEEQKAITEGTFEIVVIDVYGRAFKCSGKFPLEEE
ncbi:MAG TPA: hypothetical protein PK033_15065 [Acetivibrio sp.]|nr:hypothetical protein [Acetivibrio sp.]